MKFMFRFSSLLTTLFLIVSCTSQDEADDQQVSQSTLIFGHYYGHCFGEQCIETFKIEDGQLYEDQLDNYGHEAFDFVARSQSDYELVKDLVDLIPEELFSEESQTFGCPDCADQGGIYIQLATANSEEADLKLRLDNNQDNVPKYLHAFMDEIVRITTILE